MHGYYQVIVLDPRTKAQVRRAYFNDKEQADIFVAKMEDEGYLTEASALTRSPVAEVSG